MDVLFVRFLLAAGKGLPSLIVKQHFHARGFCLMARWKSNLRHVALFKLRTLDCHSVRRWFQRVLCSSLEIRPQACLFHNSQ